ncbi:MAG: TonB-dependent receptor [Prolixibacteraceae bacterium]|nr:TonB-dependent receptor [Prolixibacteraceae bacterium]
MRILFLLLAIFIATSNFAQYSIEGKVTSKNGEILPGASIILEGTTLGTVSNSEGNFELKNVPEKTYILKASFIGYVTYQKEIQLKTNLKINIELEEDAVLTEEVFVQATRAGRKTPVASSTISKEEIAKNNLGQDIPYLLNTTPSFVSSSDAGAGVGYTNFRIRGTDANRINVTVNGIPLNDSESHGVYWVNMPDFSSSIENLQVQRGVGTSTHGAAAFGATINMQTNALRKDAYAEYSGATGSFNTWKNTVRVGSGLLGDHFSFDARLSKISTDGFIDRAYSDLKSYFVSGGYYAKNTILKLNLFSGSEHTYQAWNGVPSVRLNDDAEGMKEYLDNWLYSEKEYEEMVNSDSRTYNIYTYENETDNYQQDHYQLLFSQQFGEYINFNAALHYTYGRGYYEQYKEDKDFAAYGLENITIGEEVIESTDLVRQKWLDNDFYGATFSLNYLKDKSDFTLGAGWNKYDGRHFGNIIWAQYASNGEKDYEWYRNEGVKTDYNIYAKYNYALTEAINLYADVQYRNILYTIEGIDDDYRDLTLNRDFDFINPKLGIFYQLNSNSKAYASWAIANREPNRSNYTDADSEEEEPTAETLNDFEVGYTFQTSTFTIGANAYYMTYKDQLILTGELNDVGAPIMANVDDSYRTGIEIMAGAQILSNLKWDVNATFSQNKIMNFTEYVDNWDTGEANSYELGTTNIAFSPNVIANSILSYEPIPFFNLSLVSQFVSKQYIDNSSNDDIALDAYFVNNIRASYKIHPSFVKEIEFTLLVNNLLNETYETNAWVYSYIFGGERFKMDGYYPQAGTNFLFGVNIKF